MKDFDKNGLRLAEFQGQLFEDSAKRRKYSSPVFMRRFYYSDLLKILDLNDITFLEFDVEEGLEAIDQEYGDSTYGKEKYSPEVMFWIGYLYRYIAYTRECRTKNIMKLFPYRKLKSLYMIYHTQDPEWCINRLLALYHLDERIFDNNWRLKEAMKDYYSTISK